MEPIAVADESPHKSGAKDFLQSAYALSPEKRAELKHRFSGRMGRSYASDVNFGMKIALYVGLGCVSADAALSAQSVLNVAGTVGLGVVFAHGVELQHQALHRLGFRNRRVNEVVGILLGLPMGVSFASYQAKHLRHHKYLGTPQNEEAFDYGDQYGECWRSRACSLWLWLKRFSMIAHYTQLGQSWSNTLLGRDFAGESPQVSRRMRRDYLLMMTVLLSLIGVSAALGVALVIWVWLLPLCLVAGPVHALIELPEHFGCDMGTSNVLMNTRSIRSNAFMTWLTNANNLHVEHHLMPSLPIERLPDLHEAIAPDIQHFHASYRQFFQSLMRGHSRAIREAGEGR